MDPDARDDPAPDAPPVAAVASTPDETPDTPPVAAVAPTPDATPAPDLTPAPADPAGTVAADLRQAAAELDGLADRPLEDHVAVYERLHARMHTALRTVEE